MKTIQTFLIIGTAACIMASCSGKKTDDNIITKKIEKEMPSAPIKMQEYEQTKDVEWIGNTYRCEIERTPDDSLAMVKDENGQLFVDNRIALAVKRSDGSVFFKRTFTKKDFNSCLDDDYRNTGILEGLVFDRAEGDNIYFAASVSHPQTDEYIPLVLRLNRMGNVEISRDTQLDISAIEEEEDI
ncbi:MAG: DUF4738 domain-containing protein [Prevotella sp.]